MQLSVVILNYNVRYFLELCIRSVQAAISNLDAEIIVVDNFSSDDSCNMVKALFPEVILIENKENFGFSKGNNIGVAKATGEYVCILNPDTVVAEDTFTKVLALAELKNNLGIIGVRLIDGRGLFLPESKRNVPSPWVSIQKIIGYSKPYYASKISENGTGKVSIMVGAFMFLMRSVYNEVGGFDEDYFMYGEDMDLSYRVIKAGYDNLYHGSTTIIHYKGESTLKDKVYAKRFNEAMQIFFKKHFKPNGLYNAVISLGIKGLILLNPKPQEKNKNVKSYLLMSETLNHKIESKLDKPVHLYDSSKQLKPHQEIIFDTQFMSFKEIIEFMNSDGVPADLTFKIHPKNSHFLIGSDSSKDRGEVIHL
ncbi:MAG: glycosyltransferase family 2 protein [Aquaticitalea sp.]